MYTNYSTKQTKNLPSQRCGSVIVGRILHPPCLSPHPHREQTYTTYSCSLLSFPPQVRALLAHTTRETCPLSLAEALEASVSGVQINVHPPELGRQQIPPA